MSDLHVFLHPIPIEPALSSPLSGSWGTAQRSNFPEAVSLGEQVVEFVPEWAGGGPELRPSAPQLCVLNTVQLLPATFSNQRERDCGGPTSLTPQGQRNKRPHCFAPGMLIRRH